MRSVVLLFFPLLVYAQTNFVSTSSYESNFQLVQSEIASVYNPKTTNFTGNKYFFKKSKDATLVLFDTDEPITGVVQTYYQHGQLATIENYKDGRRDGISEIFHYENGNWQRRENYKEGMRDGLQEKFYENGQLQIKENFIDGQKDGLREEFHSNGQLRSRESYMDGERTGFLEKYNGLGQLLSKQCFQKGRKAESSLCIP